MLQPRRVSAAKPKGEGKAEAKADAKSAGTMAMSANLPAAGVKAKGISEKAMMEKTAAERPAVVEKAQEKTESKTSKTEAKADAKADASKSSDTKSDGSRPKVHPTPTSAAMPLRRVKRKRSGSYWRRPCSPCNSPPASVVSCAGRTSRPVEAAVAPEERRDANDLARAAIERLRVNGETSSPRAPETARAPEAPSAQSGMAPVLANAPAAVTAPALRPLPPPIMVSAPPPANQLLRLRRSHGRLMPRPRPEPPDPARRIPLSRPLDLRAEMAGPSVRERATAAAEDVLSAAKSIFHAVLPK